MGCLYCDEPSTQSLLHVPKRTLLSVVVCLTTVAPSCHSFPRHRCRLCWGADCNQSLETQMQDAYSETVQRDQSSRELSLTSLISLFSTFAKASTHIL